MHIVHSASQDISDTASTDPVTVNSCGINSTIGKQCKNDLTISRPNGRKDYQLVYMCSGKAQYEINGKRRTINEGGCVLYRPSEPQHYTYKAHIPCFCRWVHFSGTYVQKLLDECCINESSFHIGTHPEIEAYFSNILKEEQRQGSQYNIFASALLIELFASMGRQRVIANDKEAYHIKQRIMKTVEHMQYHYNESLCISDYARQCNMSYYHFEHIFTQYVGMSPYAQLIRIRMDRAKELLRGSTLPISDVAQLCGYENPLYFSRAFAKQCGASPSCFRSKERET